MLLIIVIIIQRQCVVVVGGVISNDTCRPCIESEIRFNLPVDCFSIQILSFFLGKRKEEKERVNIHSVTCEEELFNFNYTTPRRRRTQ